MKSPHKSMAKLKAFLIEAIGWYGAAAIVIAYFANSFGYLPSNGFAYQILNFTGGIALAILTHAKRAYQSTIVNIIWSLIAIVALAQILM